VEQNRKNIVSFLWQLVKPLAIEGRKTVSSFTLKLRAKSSKKSTSDFLASPFLPRGKIAEKSESNLTNPSAFLNQKNVLERKKHKKKHKKEERRKTERKEQKEREKRAKKKTKKKEENRRKKKEERRQKKDKRKKKKQRRKLYTKGECHNRNTHYGRSLTSAKTLVEGTRKGEQ